MKMKKLGKRNYDLITSGVKVTGTYDPEETYFYFEESLYIDEAQEIWDFMAWCHKSEKTFGWGNYEDVFAEWNKVVVNA